MIMILFLDNKIVLLVLRDWCGDDEESVAVMVRGCLWSQALTLIRIINR